MYRTMQLPVGYKLIQHSPTEQTFERPDGSEADFYWDNPVEVVDAMWTEGRDKAVKHSGKDTFEEGAKSVDDTVRNIIKARGYQFDPPITAAETVERLLVMLNGAR